MFVADCTQPNWQKMPKFQRNKALLSSFCYKVNASSVRFLHIIQQFKDAYMYRIVSDMLQVYNITVSFGENIVKFKISDRCLFRGDLFIEKVPEPKL